MPELSIGQIVVLALAAVLFAAGAGLSVARLWVDTKGVRAARLALMWGGVLVCAALLAWHSAVRGSWMPLEDNFTALVWLGVLLALFTVYIQHARPLGGLDWFVTPIVVLLLVLAGVFGWVKPHAYVRSAWNWLHLLTAYLGAIGFFIAGASGAMYLIQNRRLRAKHSLPSSTFGSLERLEHVTLTAVTIGFSLLTVALFTGGVLYRDRLDAMGPHWWASPKIILAFAVWVIYAIVLHSPINPSFRGRRAAMLSVIGLVLMIGTLIAVQFMPSGRPS